MRIVFMGTPGFAETILRSLCVAGHDVLTAVTQPDRAGSRGKVVFSPVKEYAFSRGIPVEQPEFVKNNDAFFKKIAALSPDVIVVAAYGKIIPKNILELPKFGCINVHASLLPKFRGASPVQHAILEGDEMTGVTIMQMSEDLDAGDIIAKISIRIDGMHCPQLTEKLAEVGGSLLVDTLASVADGTADRTRQDETMATYAGIITRRDGAIDFSKHSARHILRMLAAFDPWPGVFCRMNGDILKIKNGFAVDAKYGGEPGTIIGVSRQGILVSCVEGAFLITELQMPSKKALTVEAYLAGNRIDKGTVLK